MKIFNKLKIRLNKTKKIVMSLFLSSEKMKFVHDNDLDELLESLGLADIDSGKYRCVICNKIVTRETLIAITKNKKIIGLICSNPDCIKRYVTK